MMASLIVAVERSVWGHAVKGPKDQDFGEGRSRVHVRSIQTWGCMVALSFWLLGFDMRTIILLGSATKNTIH